jgi:DNA-binding NarL/FixJ family response regulator
MAERSVRVLVVDDHTIVRQGVVALLAAQPDLAIVGEAADGREAVAAATRLRPDVVVMDLGLPQLNGVEAARQIRAACPESAVLALSMHGGEEHVRPALRAGVSGYLLKGAGLDDLVAAIRAVAVGKAFFTPEVAAIVLREARRAPAGEPLGAELSAREREVLQLVAEGRSSPEIARQLCVSVKTVEGHRARIMAKLGIHDLAGLVRYAVRTGLVSAER